jgi:integrase/recombinase XerD
LEAQKRRLAALEATVAQLEEQLAAARKNSATSSKPPSSDIVKPPKPPPPERQAQRKIGGQPGHPKHERDPSSVLIHGKGNKLRRCPLWARTFNVMIPLVSGRVPSTSVFLNRLGQPLTRFGIHAPVERHAASVAASLPSLACKRVSPHTIRHTTATHLLRAGVDINTIRAWLGHVSLSTTNLYAEVDLEMKAKALANCEVGVERLEKPWREQEDVMAFLRTL